MKTTLSSIQRALRTLQTFSADQPELGVTEISKILGVHKSSISRIISTLASEGFLEQNSVNKKYRLGLKLVDLGNLVLNRYDLRDHVRPFMEELGKRTGEIVHVAILEKNEIVYIEKQGEGQTLTVSTKIGGRSPAHASGMGKVLLAYILPEELKAVFSFGPMVKCTPFTINEKPKILKELKKIRKQGFAYDNEESFQGIRCVAAPIFNSNGKVIAALSITAPKQRMGHQRMKDLKKLIVETAQSISRQTGAYRI